MLRSPARDSQDEQHRAADREVGQSIVQVIATRLRTSAETLWAGMHFDFSGATFNGSYDFSGAQFTGGNVDFEKVAELASIFHGGPLEGCDSVTVTVGG